MQGHFFDLRFWGRSLWEVGIVVFIFSRAVYGVCREHGRLRGRGKLAA